MDKNAYLREAEEIEKKAKEIDSLRYTMLNGTEHNKLDIEKVKKDIKFVYGYEKDYFAFKEIDDNIQFLTSSIYRNDKQKYIDKIKEYDDVVKSVVKNGDNSYVIETVDGIISFTTIAELITEKARLLVANNEAKEIREYFNDISNFNTRLHECHYLSIYASYILEEYLKIKNQLVTGYTCFATEKSKYLHSWNEFSIGEKEYVLDSTLNVIMNKEGYYLLRHIDKIIERIESNFIISDYDTYGDLIFKDIKAYVTSRNIKIQEIKSKINPGEER